MFHKVHAMAAVLLLLLAITSTTNADAPRRPRGVSLAKAALYQPREDRHHPTWVCLDGTKTIRYQQINDNFCDCGDGSDEPGTAACSNGRFHCTNLGHRPQDIFSSRVNDGICDCCDGSDEYETDLCGNSCKELGQAEQVSRKNEAELHKRGASKRAELIAQGNQLRSDRELRRAELERRRSEQESLRTEKEELKRGAEAAEAEALEVYKEQQREDAAAAASEAVEQEEPTQTLREEAEINFVRYDTNKDGFVEITELQVDIYLDRDRDGVVTVEEAKYFLDERERIDLDAFVTLSWPRIKPIQMLAQGLFKPPIVAPSETNEEGEEEQQQLHQEEVHQQTNEEHEHPENFDEEEEEDAYEDEDADVGVGSVTADEPPLHPSVEYDPETQRLVELANAARNAHSEVDREIREIEQELKEIDEQNAKDYGVNEEFAAMDGECYSFEEREYVYTLCPFDRASQKQRSGGAETTLGRWDAWVGEGDNKYSKQKYAHGASCWNGPQRSAVVQLKCALDHKVISVSEPSRCEYFFEFETPAACGVAYEMNEENLHDEL